jgi:hypothetical protein
MLKNKKQKVGKGKTTNQTGFFTQPGKSSFSDEYPQ